MFKKEKIKKSTWLDDFCKALKNKQSDVISIMLERSLKCPARQLSIFGTYHIRITKENISDICTSLIKKKLPNDVEKLNVFNLFTELVMMVIKNGYKKEMQPIMMQLKKSLQEKTGLKEIFEGLRQTKSYCNGSVGLRIVVENMIKFVEGEFFSSEKNIINKLREFVVTQYDLKYRRQSVAQNQPKCMRMIQKLSSLKTMLDNPDAECSKYKQYKSEWKELSQKKGINEQLFLDEWFHIFKLEILDNLPGNSNDPESQENSTSLNCQKGLKN
jgi:hypothetical protein